MSGHYCPDATCAALHVTAVNVIDYGQYAYPILPQGWVWPQTFTTNTVNTRACNCVGGDNCCIKVGERQREADIRADERAKVLRELA